MVIETTEELIIRNRFRQIAKSMNVRTSDRMIGTWIDICGTDANEWKSYLEFRRDKLAKEYPALYAEEV